MAPNAGVEVVVVECWTGAELLVAGRVVALAGRVLAVAGARLATGVMGACEAGA